MLEWEVGLAYIISYKEWIDKVLYIAQNIL